VPCGVRLERAVLRGDPAAEILSLAERAGADVIAVGSHGHSALGRMLVGSVATKLLRNAQCSLLLEPATRGSD
jgi:nucleotide-binding universal stress UspA family protein